MQLFYLQINIYTYKNTFYNYKTVQFCNNQSCKRNKKGTLMHKIYKKNVCCNMIYNKRNLKERKANAKQYDIIKYWHSSILELF